MTSRQRTARWLLVSNLSFRRRHGLCALPKALPGPGGPRAGHQELRGQIHGLVGLQIEKRVIGGEELRVAVEAAEGQR